MLRLRWFAAGLLAVGLCALAAPATPTAPAPVGLFRNSPVPDFAAIDLPAEQHMRNVGGSDGAGLCVFTSIEIAARWANVRALDGFQKWMTRRPGGGYPEKVDAMLKQFCAAKGVAVPHYVQHTGGDVAFLELAVKTRRMAGVTYSGRDNFYRGPIAHMVDLAHLDADRAAIVDNNRPGVWVQMSRAEFIARWTENMGWAFVLLAPPPPPATLPMIGQCPDGRCPLVPLCPDGRCPLVRPDGPDRPAPIGLPPTPDHEWGVFADGQWGWRLKGNREPLNFGIDPERVGEKSRYWVDGVECSRDEAIAAVGEGLTDDSDRYHLSIVTADTKAAAKALTDPRVGPLLAKCHVQIYAPDSWVARTRLSAVVTLQEPAAKGGKVLGTAAGLDADQVAELLGSALDPKPKPDPEPVPEPQPDPRPVPVRPDPDAQPRPVRRPRPEPCPCPQPCPEPCPCPAPCPAPAGSSAEDVWSAIAAALAGLHLFRRAKKESE